MQKELGALASDPSPGIKIEPVSDRLGASAQHSRGYPSARNWEP